MNTAMSKNAQINIALIDGQNLHFGTTKCGVCSLRTGKNIQSMKLVDCSCGEAWKVNLQKFRTYLLDKYKIDEAYYFIGFAQNQHRDLYSDIQRAGFIVLFREHDHQAKSLKKGNVDADVIFEAMRNLIDNVSLKGLLIVSGDGDYFRLVHYLVHKNRFIKILFPNRQFASSLYFRLGSERYDYLEHVRSKISETRNYYRK